MVERTKLTQGGRIVIPVGRRKALGVEIGDEVLLRLEGGALRVYTRAEALKRAQQAVRKYVPKGVSLVEELLRERRQEAQDE